ncbi:MAG: hypothetical protein AAF499_00780, partial [Pseudomonadota bacterium]
MKKHLAATTLIFALAVPVQANEWVIGASLGLINPGGVNSDRTPAVTGGASLGLEFLDLGVLDIGATLEYLTSLSDAEIDNRDTEVTATSLWLTARTLGPLYAIARTGLVDVELDPSNTGVSNDRESALSVGLGFSVGVRTEIMYTRIDHDQGDATHWLGLH